MTLTALALPTAAQDPLKEIKSKEAEARVAAVEGLAKLGGEAAEKALISALLDRDWEVVERAANALREIGTKAAVPQLVRTVVDAPAWRLRRAAALALAKIDPVRATEELAKQTAGKNATRAWPALALVAPHAGGAQAETITKNLKKLQKAKEDDEKLAAAGGIAGATKEEMLSSLEGYLAGDEIERAAAALRAVASKPEAETLAKLQSALAKPRVNDVLERRLIFAVAQIASSVDAAVVTGVLEALTKSNDAGVAARGMRLAAALAQVEGTRSAALTALEVGASHANADVRAAAVHAGGKLKHAPVLQRARDLVARDSDDRVRLIALIALTEHVGVGDQGVFDACVARLKEDSDGTVRETAAVALAKASSEASVAALSAALADTRWTVAVCAAVSLGKTTHAAAVEPLLALSKHADWKLRGAAIVGLCHVTKNEAVPAVLAAIGDAEPSISKTALIYAKALTKQDFGPDTANWLKWWGENQQRVRMWTPEEVRARREKYGYAVSLSEVYKDLDVIVLDSRGDHIQNVLDLVKAEGQAKGGESKGGESKGGEAKRGALDTRAIHYRMTAAARHRIDGLPPHGVYVSNCTGEVEASDIECIQWFVRTGGYLFGSCWSLGETIDKVYPGVARARHLENELATVSAEPIAEGSPYLAGVFDGGVEPHYNLEGPHMIEVLDRERCEVLVDSPQCAAKYGVGNMTVWFRAGHGLIFDSVNHFDNQGLVNATWLDENEERQAYAVDRMAYPYAEWRATSGEKWWSSNTKAAERVFDRTALHLVTNFVRSKRLEEM